MHDHDISLLNDAQKACLRLVLQHKGSKDIARILGVSPHTVDARIKTAMRLLGTTNRVEAAQVLALREDDSPYQPLVYQSPVYASTGLSATPEPEGGEDHFAGYGFNAAHSFSQPAAPQGAAALGEARQVFMPFPDVSDPLPHFRAWGGRNDLTVLQRLAIAMAIAMGSALSFGAILAGLEALSRVP